MNKARDDVKAENDIIIFFTVFFISEKGAPLNPSMPKKSTDPFKIWSNFQLWHFFQGGTKLPAWPKISQIDGNSRYIGWVGGGGESAPHKE